MADVPGRVHRLQSVDDVVDHLDVAIGAAERVPGRRLAVDLPVPDILDTDITIDHRMVLLPAGKTRGILTIFQPFSLQVL